MREPLQPSPIVSANYPDSGHVGEAMGHIPSRSCMRQQRVLNLTPLSWKGAERAGPLDPQDVADTSIAWFPRVEIAGHRTKRLRARLQKMD